MLNFLPEKLNEQLKKIEYNLIYEIRIRANKPIKICYNSEYLYVTTDGLSKFIKNAIILSFEEIENIVLKISNYSMYSVSNQITNGYITTTEGVRIGLAGEAVIENDKILAITNITSLNIRIPHEIKNSSNIIFENCFKEKLKSVLIMSPPGFGKTTILRDLALNISNNYEINQLIIDERNEIAAINKNASFNLGMTTDVIKFMPKRFAFEIATRSLRPDLIITDELSCENDIISVRQAILAGINVIASSHFKNILSIIKDKNFNLIIKEKIFDYYVILSSEKIGQVVSILDNKLNFIYGLN